MWIHRRSTFFFYVDATMSSMWLDGVGRMTVDNACFMYKERKKADTEASNSAEGSGEQKTGTKRILGHTHGFNRLGTDERARCSHRRLGVSWR